MTGRFRVLPGHALDRIGRWLSSMQSAKGTWQQYGARSPFMARDADYFVVGARQHSAHPGYIAGLVQGCWYAVSFLAASSRGCCCRYPRGGNSLGTSWMPESAPSAVRCDACLRGLVRAHTDVRVIMRRSISLPARSWHVRPVQHDVKRHRRILHYALGWSDTIFPI